MINMPVDLALGVIFPLHAHIGMNWIISDYVPPAMRGSSRMLMVRIRVPAFCSCCLLA